MELQVNVTTPESKSKWEEMMEGKTGEPVSTAASTHEHPHPQPHERRVLGLAMANPQAHPPTPRTSLKRTTQTASTLARYGKPNHRSVSNKHTLREEGECVLPGQVDPRMKL